jgi:hypothetical protein
MFRRFLCALLTLFAAQALATNPNPENPIPTLGDGNKLDQRAVFSSPPASGPVQICTF